MELDLARVRHLADPQTAEGRRLLAELFAVYLDDAAAKVTRLREALEEARAAAVRTLAHELKGSSAVIGASGLAERFGDVERQALDGCVGEPAILDDVQRRLASLRAEMELLVGKRLVR